MTDTDLLPADPARHLTSADLAEAELTWLLGTYDFGMSTAVGAARLRLAVADVEATLVAGLPRRVAVAVLRGHLVQLDRDGLVEYSDTVVRESVAADMEGAFVAAGHRSLTDGEVNEVALLLSLRSLDAHVAGWRKGAVEAGRGGAIGPR